MRYLRTVLTLGLLGLVGRADAQVASGPAAGDAVPVLKAFAVTGPQPGKDVDVAVERKDRPTVYLFVQAAKWDRPMARFVKELDQAARIEGDEFPVVAVWLTDQADEARDYLPRAQQSLQLSSTALTVFAGQAGPDGWGINDMAHLTVVVASKGKAVKTFGFQSVNETDVKDVREALKKAREIK